MQKNLEAANPANSKQVFNNLNTALNQFLVGLTIPADAVVGVELRTSYYKLVSRHLENMQAAARSDKAIRDRKSLLKKWRTLFIEIARQHSAYLREQSPFVSALNEALPQGVTLEAIAKQAGVPYSSLKRWRSGQVPTPRSLPTIRRLEKFLALPAGDLTDFVMGSSQANINPSSPTPIIPYREQLKKSCASPYRLTSASEVLKQQWLDFMYYKTTPLPFDIKRSERGRWNPTPLHPGADQKAKKWFAFTPDDQYVPSAGIAWNQVSAFLGWLTLHGGQPETAQTLALFTDINLIGRYLSWYIQRAGNKVNGGHVGFVQFVLTLLHPETGYLTQKPELRLTLADDTSDEQWAVRCHTAFTKLKDQLKALKRVETKSRNPDAPVAAVLQLANPMLALKDMLQRIRTSRPTAGTYTEAIWGRDLLLIGLMVCSPLRAKNLRHLIYCNDGTGNLRRKPDGTWELTIVREHFKNHQGAAAKREYRIVLDAGIYRDIEAYLETFRPMLLNGKTAATDLLFVSSESGIKNQPWQSLNRHVETLTRKYLMQCPGVGPHVVRHLVATGIIKKTGEYSTAALVLHDEEDTIKKSYSHLCSEDGHTRFRKLFPEIFEDK
jgi:transcriptional regulator with XRE-family HTH domain